MKPRQAREKRWVVREGDGSTVGEIVARAGEDASAVDEGRVFVGRARVKSAGESVRVGDEVKIGARAVATAPAWKVIWERDGLLACEKPSGIPTVPDHLGSAHALVALAAAASGRKASELYVTSRLDREVSGVVVFATTEEAEARLRKAREAGAYTRRYVAIARDADIAVSAGLPALEAVSAGLPALEAVSAGLPALEAVSGLWDAPIGGGVDARHRAAFGPDAKPATTRWAVVARAGGFAMLAVEPQTGRTHQIRVHASHAGAPLLGDRDYGGASRVTLPSGRVLALSRIALHAARVALPRSRGSADARGEASLVAKAPIPAELASVWTELGGASEAWDRAVSCVLET